MPSMETCLATHLLCIFFPCCLGNTGNRVASVGDISGITDVQFKDLNPQGKKLNKIWKIKKLLKLKPSKETD